MGNHYLENAVLPWEHPSTESGAQGSCTQDEEGRVQGHPVWGSVARARLAGAGASSMARLRAGPGR